MGIHLGNANPFQQPSVLELVAPQGEKTFLGPFIHVHADLVIESSYRLDSMDTTEALCPL